MLKGEKYLLEVVSGPLHALCNIHMFTHRHTHIHNKLNFLKFYLLVSLKGFCALGGGFMYVRSKNRYEKVIRCEYACVHR